MLLPFDVLYELLPFLDVRSFVQFARTTKSNCADFNWRDSVRLVKEVLVLRNWTTLEIQTFLAHVTNTARLHVMESDMVPVGYTGYLDSFAIGDFPQGKNILVGCDSYDRPFLTILDDDNIPMTLFRRYSDGEGWTTAGKGKFCNRSGMLHLKDFSEPNLLTYFVQKVSKP